MASFVYGIALAPANAANGDYIQLDLQMVDHTVSLMH